MLSSTPEQRSTRTSDKYDRTTGILTRVGVLSRVCTNFFLVSHACVSGVCAIERDTKNPKREARGHGKLAGGGRGGRFVRFAYG